MVPDYTHRCVQRLWNSCWYDATRCFGRKSLGVSQSEVLNIHRKHKVVDEDSGFGTGGIIPCIAVVPRHPAKKIGVENSAIITRPQRKILMQVWNSCRDDDVYKELLEKLLRNDKA
jgi:hypothetical protein